MLSRLLRPSSIAVFGGKWAANVIAQCRRMNYDGEIWPVHPKRAEMAGVACFPAVDKLPKAPDAAFVGINRYASVETLRQLSAMGCGGAVCFASGYKEAGEESLQDELIAAAADMPLLGPNCYGFINYLDGALLWPDQQGGCRVDRGVAIITQSSNIAINLTMQKRALPLAYIICAGNQAQLSMAAIARGLLDNEQVSAIGMHIEGVANAVEFADLASAAQVSGKPLVALKSGKTECARTVAVSHTASIVGDAVVSSAFLRRCKVAEVNTIPEFLETLKLLHINGPLRDGRITSMSCSGGEAGLIADAGEKRNITWAPLPPDVKDKLSEHLGPLVQASNPLDYHTFIWGDKAALQKTFSLIMRADADMNLLVLDYPRDDRCSDADWALTTDALAAAIRQTDGDSRTAVVASLPECMLESRAHELATAGITPFCGVEEALAAVEAAAFLGGNGDVNWRPLPVLPQCLPCLLDEFESKKILKQAGIAVPESKTAETPEKAAAAAQTLGGEMVLKALGIAHKSEKKAVRLGLSAAEVKTAAAGMSALGNGFLVERLVKNAAAEVIVGVSRDVVYGAALTVGMGGVQAELLNDAVTLILPTNEKEILAAFSRLKLSALLFGYRGAPVADVAAAVQVALSIAELLENDETIEEIEINPLLLMPDKGGAIAVDALIRKR